MAEPEVDIDWSLPATSMSSEDFERFVLAHFDRPPGGLEDYEVTWNRSLDAPDGTYQIDGTIEFMLHGARFVNLVEAKLHQSPIKRELVAALNDKKRSLGAHKATMASTARFQSGAVKYAKIHGIALIQIVRGEFAFVVNSLLTSVLQPPQYVAQMMYYWPKTDQVTPVNLARPNALYVPSALGVIYRPTTSSMSRFDLATSSSNTPA